MNKLIVAWHVGTHGSCVRLNGLVYSPITPHLSTCLLVHLSTYSACADARTVRPYIPIVTISHFKMGHFTVQHQPFYTMKWPILHAKMADIETQVISC